MTHSPPEPIRQVGKEYFADRFGLAGPDGSRDVEETFHELPLRHPTVDTIQANQATLEMESCRVPLFQDPAAVRGKPIWTARSAGRHIAVGAIDDGTLVLGFDPWATMGGGLVGFATTVESAEDPVSRPDKLPWVDQLAGGLATALGSIGCTLPVRKRWPGNARFAVSLTHDVDRTRKTFQYMTHFGRRKGLPGVSVKSRPRGRAYWGFDTIQDIERGANVRSTFFLLQEGPEAKRGPRNRLLAWGLADFEDPEVSTVARSLSQGGWEIGLHASLASTESVERLTAEKQKIESMLGTSVTGVRQHHLRLRLPERWDEFSNQGFGYDASLGFRDTWGFRGGTAFPYRLAGSKGVLPLREVPLHLMDSTLAASAEPWRECVQALDSVESVGGVLTILFHQRFFDVRSFPGYADLYERLIEEARRRGAWIAPLRDVVRA